MIYQYPRYLVYHHVGLQDEGYGNVANGLGRTRGYLLPVISRIVVDTAIATCLLRLWRVDRPLLQAMHTKIVLVILQKLMQTGTVHVGELYLHLSGGDAIDVALHYILFARSRRLYHLIDGAITTLQILVGKIIGDVVDDDRLLVADERGVVLALTYETFVDGVRHSG